MSSSDEQKRKRRLASNLNGESACAAQFLASDPSFLAAIRAPTTELAPSPVAVFKRHAIPKLAIAGIDHSRVLWEDVQEVLHRQEDPAIQPSDTTDERDDSAIYAPRG